MMALALPPADLALLDYFAAHALAGVLNNNGLLPAPAAAQKAYCYAEAMLVERIQRRPAAGCATPTPDPASLMPTAEQEAEIRELVQHASITRPERAQVLLDLPAFTRERAEKVLFRLRQRTAAGEAGGVVIKPKFSVAA